MTKLLFYENAYMKEAKAKVVKIEGSKVWLDQTIFFAFSGGQASDKGTIEGIEVSDIIKDEDYAHVLVQEPTFNTGDVVELKLDWDNRYKLMRLHSAAHIAYYLLFQKIGSQEIIGSNIRAEKARIDILYNEPISKFLPEIQEHANAAIDKGIEIITKADDKEPEKRWWICGEWKMPCGGTHVKNTKEIRHIRLKRDNIGAGKERIEITLNG